jgi:magnesium and cobalt transporter
MEDPSKPRPAKNTWLDRLSAFILREPGDREDLVELLHGAFERHLLDSDGLTMIEGVLSVAEMTVRDVMVPRSQIDVLSIDQPIESLLPIVVDTAHSRFPVIGEDKDDVLGILLAKDLLRYFHAPQNFNLKHCLRPALFVPESKPLNMLLRDFRATRNHMAIVVDEFGGVCGLVTIEDVIEQIVGDIEDEHDIEEGEDDIVPVKGGRFRVKATTELEDFNSYFDTEFVSDEVGTIGGLLLAHAGHLPKRGDVIELDPLRFTIMRADSRRLHLLLVEKPSPAATQ